VQEHAVETASQWGTIIAVLQRSAAGMRRCGCGFGWPSATPLP